jgi:hypothetical protein
MIELRQYRPEDYMTIQRRHFDSLTFLNFPDPNAIARNLSRGPAFTLTNGIPIACGGVLPLWKGVGEGWVVSSPLVEKHSFLFARTAWRKIMELVETMDLVRLQTLVDAEYRVSRRWVERMGFVNEGVMRKYLGGRDYIRYALIREN